MKTTALIEKGKDGTFGIFTPDIQATIIGEGRTGAAQNRTRIIRHFTVMLY